MKHIKTIKAHKTIKAQIIKLAFPKWWNRSLSFIRGYTLLMPVPSDLPVFTKLALDVISKQDLTHLNEVIIIPDVPSKKFRQIFDEMKDDKLQKLKLLEMRTLSRLIGRVKSGNTYHFLQIINGINESRSSHVLFHDADLFLKPGGFLRERFELCASHDFSVLGVHPRKARYTEECQHLVATWEMIAKNEWLHKFKPYQLRAQHARINGKIFSFDTLHLAQHLSSPDEIRFETPDSTNFVHLGYIVTTYRRFLKSVKPYVDQYFKILFIRLLIDSQDVINWDYELPSYDDCLEGLKGRNEYISYISLDNQKEYPEFRQQMEKLNSLGCFDQRVNDIIFERLLPFDKHYGWSSSKNA